MIIKKHAFTLAEVLITLGVIGVVAAVTLPAVIQNYQKHAVETQIKKAYSMFNQALQMSVAQNGEAKYWDETLGANNAENSRLFTEKYIVPYLKGVNFCGGREDINANKCSATCGVGEARYSLPNGISFAVCKYLNAKQSMVLTINIDNSAKNAGIGKNKFTFNYNLDNGKLLPWYYDASKTAEEYINGFVVPEGYKVACKKVEDDENVTTYLRHTCTALLYINNWKIPKNYPW